MQTFTEQLKDHISFSYSSFDRVLLRGYLPGLFIEGSVIRLLRNLGFSNHSNGVLRTLTDQFNTHIIKITSSLDIKTHWWGEPEKQKYHSKIDFVEEHYNTLLMYKKEKKQFLRFDNCLKYSFLKFPEMCFSTFPNLKKSIYLAAQYRTIQNRYKLKLKN